MFFVAVKEKTVLKPKTSKLCHKAAFAPSLAYPTPQYWAPSRQPISYPGPKGASKSICFTPMKPRSASSLFRSTAIKNGCPASANAFIRSTAASLLDLSFGGPRNSITAGSALIRANGARSVSRHDRRISRSVSIIPCSASASTERHRVFSEAALAPFATGSRQAASHQVRP